jgi:hypothetical protein
MSLESGTYIDDLVVTNPTGTDAKSQGDDHLRLIKSVLKNSLVGIDAKIMEGTGGICALFAGGVERLRIATTGLISLAATAGLQISKTAVTAPAASDGNVFSGTYTPTLTNTTNVAASSAFGCQYMRVGSVVTVSGRVSIDPTATGRIVLGMSLPVASSLGTLSNVGGTFSVAGVTASPSFGAINAGVGVASFDGVINDAAARDYFFTFTYRVI